jgi:hypothetical protein
VGPQNTETHLSLTSELHTTGQKHQRQAVLTSMYPTPYKHDKEAMPHPTETQSHDKEVPPPPKPQPHDKEVPPPHETQ